MSSTFKDIHSVRSGENLVALSNSVRSGDSFHSFERGEFDGVRSYQHKFEIDIKNGDDDDDEDDSMDVDDESELTYSPNSEGYNNCNSKEGDDDTRAVLWLFILILIGWTFFTADTAEYEVIMKHKSPHQYVYQKEEVHSCEKDGCGLHAQADDRHKNVTHILNNNTEIQHDPCGWGDKTKYMEGDSVIHFEARKNVGKGCTYCKNKVKCVYKHPLYAMCLSDSQCMSNNCGNEQLCTK